MPEGGITAPAAIAGALLVGTTRYGLFLMSPLDGRPIDGIDLGSGFAETPAAYGSRAFVLSNAGTLPRGPGRRSVDAVAPGRAGAGAGPVRLFVGESTRAALRWRVDSARRIRCIMSTKAKRSPAHWRAPR